MIVAPIEGRLLVITQNDHAHLSGELLSLWRSGSLAEHPRLQQILLAAREHDNGWREADSAPRHDPESGRPHDYLSIPGEIRRQIWRRGTERFRHREPYVALLIVRHALELHRAQHGNPAWVEQLAEWRALQEELREEAYVAAEELERDYRWIELSDAISLALCERWRKSFELHGHRFEAAGDELALDPFPFAGATTFRTPCRQIADRRYRSDTDLGGELAAARWGEREVRVVPRSDAGV